MNVKSPIVLMVALAVSVIAIIIVAVAITFLAGQVWTEVGPEVCKRFPDLKSCMR